MEAETIRIGDKTYKVADLNKTVKDMVGDIQKIEGEMGRLALKTSIANLAKSALLEKLMPEIAKVTPIAQNPEPAAPAAPVE